MNTPSALSTHEFAALMADLGVTADEALAVAVSGGADSMALLRLVAQWGNNVTALTYDHGLRAEAQDEAAQVGAWCADIGVPHHILKWQGACPSGDVQQSAREARYRDLENWCRDHHVGHLLLAHHQDDQAETVLMRLMRGSGVDGLAAMKKTSPSLTGDDGLYLQRPLLNVPKSRLVATLEHMQQSWIEDPSNVDERYLRARVRATLAQFDEEGLNPLRLSLTASRMARVRDYFDDVVDRWFQAHAELHDAAFIALSLDVLQHEHPELRGRLLSRLLQGVSGHRHPPTYEAVLRVDEGLQGDFSGMTNYGCRLWGDGGQLFVAREYAAIKNVVTIGGDDEVVWDARFKITRHGGDGDLGVEALGEDGWIELLQHFPDARDRSMPHPVRLTLPAFKADGKIVAVPHLGYASPKAGALECRFAPRRRIF